MKCIFFIYLLFFNKLMSEDSAARIAQANLGSKNDIADFVKRIDTDDKLKNANKNITANKTKHVDSQNKITDLTNTVVQISEKGYKFLLGRIYFAVNNGYQFFSFFVPIVP